MPNNRFPSEHDELLDQTVSDSELREILERIGHDEYNGNPQPTVRDIVEGTSADPAVIGRILGDIRKEDWEERFGLQLRDHEERIESLETKPPQPPTVIHHYHEVPVRPTETKANSYNSGPRRLYGYGSKEKTRTSPFTYFFAAILVYAILFCFKLMCAKMH